MTNDPDKSTEFGDDEHIPEYDFTEDDGMKKTMDIVVNIPKRNYDDSASDLRKNFST